jgi:hypothetical protein
MALTLLMTALIGSPIAWTARAGLEDSQARAPGFVRVSADHRSFEVEKGETVQPFVPWGFNYDHDAKEPPRLLEDYWEAEWTKVVDDFREMKDLGANVVRIHLQVGKFLDAADRPNAAALERLGQLLELAEQTGLYLDLTGLACYRKEDVPAWYDELDEPGRWAAQATFWEAVASRSAASPAVFCYDLMNEPVVAGDQRPPGGWLAGAFGGFHYVQFISLDAKGRPRPEVARQWITAMVEAIRKHDARHLVTVGLVDWSLDRPGLTSGFSPKVVAPGLDFLCVHLYPKAGKLDEATETLRGFAEAGKPVLIEETFPLMCSADEFRAFLKASKPLAAGWVGFYWGETVEELKAKDPKTIHDAFKLGWLEIFRAGPP